MFAPELVKLELRHLSFVGALALLENDHDTIDKPAADVQSLFDALASRRVTESRSTHHGCSRHMNEKWKVVGRWHGGHFRFVEKALLVLGVRTIPNEM